MYGWGHTHVIGRLIDVGAIVSMEWGGWWFGLWLGWACARLVESSDENVASVGSSQKPTGWWYISPWSRRWFPPLLQRRRVLSLWMALDDCWVMLKVWRWWRGLFPDIETLYARGSSVPTHIFENLAALWFHWVVEDGCYVWMDTVVMEQRSAHRQEGCGGFFFSLSSLRLLHVGKFLSCQFPPITVSYCILLTHILTTW